MSLMGLDVGTTRCKAVVFDEQGRCLAEHAVEYRLVVESEGQAELEPETVWNAATEVIRAAAKQAGTATRDPVTAVGLSVLGDGFTPVDRHGTPLGRSVTGHLDIRAAAQARGLAERFGREALFELTGMPIHSMYVLPKILWYQERRPDVWERAARFAGWQELLHLRLGLQPVMDLSLGGRTMVVDVHTGDWARELMSAVGLSPEQFYPLVRSTAVVGRLDPSHAEELGLRTGTAIVAGGFDQSCCALGAGVLGSDTAGLSVGTGECATVIFDRLNLSPALLAGNHCCGFHVLDGRYMTFGAISAAGGVLQWYRDTMGVSDRDRALQEGRDPYEAIIAEAPDRPARVFMLPYLAGTSTPWLDPLQRGAIFGLSLDTDRPEIVKGVLDGVCYELRVNLESLGRAGFAPGSIRATGGGARSARWMQLKADITGLPIEIMEVGEAGCRGAAFLAGLGTGIYSSPEEITALSRVKHRFEPRTSQKAAYDAAYGKYLELRERVEGLHF